MASSFSVPTVTRGRWGLLLSGDQLERAFNVVYQQVAGRSVAVEKKTDGACFKMADMTSVEVVDCQQASSAAGGSVGARRFA